MDDLDPSLRRARSQHRTALAALLVTTSLAAACAPTVDADPDAPGYLGTDARGLGGDAGPDGTPHEDAGAAPLALDLRVESADGACAELSRVGRAGPAVRFVITGRAGAAVQLWVDKPACGVEPFVFRELSLDGSGRGAVEVIHGGSRDCSENLLGGWRAWIVDGVDETARADVVFANAECGAAASCGVAAGFCPGASDEPLIARDRLFVLSAAERPLFEPPAWFTEWGRAYEVYPLRNLWEAFDEGRAPVPLSADAGPSDWYELDGRGSQNHALLWIGESALGHAFAGDVAQYENAATRALRLLELDALQGHMRHEAVGQYASFWEGGIALMALAGLYAPEGSTSGPALLAEARRWWADHVAVLRLLSMPDGQVGLVGARLPGASGTDDSWKGIGPALNLQLVDPRPHDQLHPALAALVTADGQPAGGSRASIVSWNRPRSVAERWGVLRAVQSGALPPVAADHPAPPTALDVYRWEAGGRVHIATPNPYGYRAARWYATWRAGSLVRVEMGDASNVSGGKGPHPPLSPLSIPSSAAHVLSP